MASLSKAPFASPNTRQLSPSHSLLPSHLSMDPTSSATSLSSTLSHQQYSPAELSGWIQKPCNAKLPFDHPVHRHTAMNSLSHQYGLGSCPLLDEYTDVAAAADSIERGFLGGDDPLLTSSWDALDKLVSATMTSSRGSVVGSTLTELAHASTLTQCTSPSSMITGAVEQTPSRMVINSCDNQNGPAAGDVWGNSQANACSNNFSNGYSAATCNVGWNLASLISADRGFVERAAKYSSYSQQINQACSGSRFQNFNHALNKTNNPVPVLISSENINLSGSSKLSEVITASKELMSSHGAFVYRGIGNAGMEHDAVTTNDTSATALVTKQTVTPQATMANSTGSKRKRELPPNQDGEVDDARPTGRKKTKGGERKHDEAVSKNGQNSSKVDKGNVCDDEKTRMQQCQKSISVASEEKSGGDSKETKSKLKSTCSTSDNNKSGLSPPEAPKQDFVHVRARRGQATDSHSLAERVRRERISERMKCLQDLVPGCTKVTGKAMMLEEIINYVQSLQRQVEFLSMKLAAVHPSKLEFNFERLFGKQVEHQQAAMAQINHIGLSYPLLHPHLQQLQPSPHEFPTETMQAHAFGSDAVLQQTVSMLAAASSETFGEQCISPQIAADAWDEDLQNLVQLGFPQAPLSSLHPSLHGGLFHSQMKTEL